MQGIADEGTPPREFGDTYSQSTDPSDDDDGDMADEPKTTVPDSHAVAQEAFGASVQSAQQHQSLEEQPSVALDTQNDPADNIDMQEGEVYKCTVQCDQWTVLHGFQHMWHWQVWLLLQVISWIWIQFQFLQKSSLMLPERSKQQLQAVKQLLRQRD